MSGVFAMIKGMSRPVAHLCALLVAVAICVSLLVAKLIGVNWLAIALVACVALVQGVIFWLALRTFARDINRRALGVLGERIVATQLAELACEGHIVVHDLQCANMNIDHLIIGPKGIFVVETKMRSKPVDKRIVVAVEGEGIRVDGGPLDSSPIRQVRMGMSLVRDKLPVSPDRVKGYVVYPELWVQGQSPSDVAVLNDKMVFGDLRRRPDVFSQAEVKSLYTMAKTIFDAELRAWVQSETQS